MHLTAPFASASSPTARPHPLSSRHTLSLSLTSPASSRPPVPLLSPPLHLHLLLTTLSPAQPSPLANLPSCPPCSLTVSPSVLLPPAPPCSSPSCRPSPAPTSFHHFSPTCKPLPPSCPPPLTLPCRRRSSPPPSSAARATTALPASSWPPTSRPPASPARRATPSPQASGAQPSALPAPPARWPTAQPIPIAPSARWAPGSRLAGKQSARNASRGLIATVSPPMRGHARRAMPRCSCLLGGRTRASCAPTTRRQANDGGEGSEGEGWEKWNDGGEGREAKGSGGWEEETAEGAGWSRNGERVQVVKGRGAGRRATRKWAEGRQVQGEGSHAKSGMGGEELGGRGGRVKV